MVEAKCLIRLLSKSSRAEEDQETRHSLYSPALTKQFIGNFANKSMAYEKRPLSPLEAEQRRVYFAPEETIHRSILQIGGHEDIPSEFVSLKESLFHSSNRLLHLTTGFCVNED